VSGPTTAREQLPEALRRAVDQTVAAERLEGWCPTGAHLDALAALLCGEMCFDDYLAGAAARHLPDTTPSRRDHWRALRRRQPYLIPGTTLLRNNFGVTHRQALAELEFVATAGRIALWHRRSAHGGLVGQDVDFRAVHRHVFADVYPWAGDYRVTELRRGDAVFAKHHAVPGAMAVIEQSARTLAVSAERFDAAALGYQLARLYAEYNQIHPFREGNGRTGTLLLHTVAALCGHRLDLTGVTRDEWYSASRDSMPFRRGSGAGGVNPRPFVPLLNRALG
jgi:cell filamentation protein, protein adenylyltransferase